MLPSVGQLGRESFGKCMCLTTKQSICGAYKRGKVLLLLKAGFKILTFLFFFLCLDHFFRISVSIGLGVSIGDSDIDYTVGASAPESL